MTRWGIIGTGKIARLVGDALAKSERCQLRAVGSRSAARARGFAEQFRVESSYSSYEGVVEDAQVDVVYVATDHTWHERLTVASLEAGKHVLCEKPLAVDANGVARIEEAAKRSGGFCMEAYPFLSHPQTKRLVELLEAGEIGEVRLVTASFGYDAGKDPGNYLLRHDLAGGSILDVGCYTTAVTELVAVAAGKGVKGVECAVGEVDSEAGVDTMATAVLGLSGGGYSLVTSAIQLGLVNDLRVYGSEGRLVAPDPWLPGREGDATTLSVSRYGKEEQQLRFDGGPNVYEREVEEVDRLVSSGERQHPLLGIGRSWRNARVLDEWRRAVGVQFASESDQY